MANGKPVARECSQANVQRQRERPSLPWRVASSLVVGMAGMISRGFLYGLNSVEVTGLQSFLDVLDKRKDVERRERGLVTVCNHISILDDPLMWGVLPARFLFNPSNMRWALGAHDICFKNKALATFFSMGQVLPTHRHTYSAHGGLFQPTIAQAIRLLSSAPFSGPRDPEDSTPSSPSSSSPPSPSCAHQPITDPFTSGGLTYSTTGLDGHPSPSAFAQNRHGWVHVFPEGCIHQHPQLTMRYFKWGLSRLILESEPMPDIVPIFIDGTQHIMHEERGWPRFAPRVGRKLHVAFGDLLDTNTTFGDLRARWRELVRRSQEREREREQEQEQEQEHKPPPAMGELSDELKFGPEAVRLRIEVARRVRDEIEKLRLGLGYPEDDAAFGLAETWAKEPAEKEKFRSAVDGSIVRKE